MYMLIMGHVHHLITEIKGKKPTIKCLKILTKLLQHHQYLMPVITVCFEQIFPVVAKMCVHKMVEIKKEEVESPGCYLVP